MSPWECSIRIWEVIRLDHWEIVTLSEMTDYHIQLWSLLSEALTFVFFCERINQFITSVLYIIVLLWHIKNTFLLQFSLGAGIAQSV
jgi:hypothetical protein